MTNCDYSAPRILIVDDNPSIHRDFELVLLDKLENAALEADERRMFGHTSSPNPARPAYTLEHAFSGVEGVGKIKQALAQNRPFQLAFVDIRMPGIDGVETISRIWHVDPAVQVVICTAYADYSSEDLARRLGQTDKLLVLKKPFDSIEVVLLADTLTEKWFLAKKAALKLEQMELLVAQRTQRLLDLQRTETLKPVADTSAPPEGRACGKEPPQLLLAGSQADVLLSVSQAVDPEFRLVEARDGEQALRLALETVPDLVIADVALLQLDGIQLCRRLKADELTSHVPIVLLGACGNEQDRIKALEAGADDYLSAPLSAPLLKARVDNLLRSHRKSQEHLTPEVAFQPRDMAANQVDVQFLRRLMDTVERHLSDFELDVDALAQKMAVSRRQLFRKLKAVTGQTPNALIRAIRLRRAAHLLKHSQMTVTEITYAVGFSDLKHFRSLFREHFGVLPGEYAGKDAEPRPSPAL